MKLMKLKKAYFVIAILVFFISYMIDVNEYVAIENLDIPIGIGYDLINGKTKNPLYSIPISVYQFLPGNSTLNTIVTTGKAEGIANTREDRQTKSNRKFILGTEKVVLIGQEVAEKSIEDIINILFNNTYANDTARVAIFKGKTMDALKTKVKGYNSSADYIRGMIDSCIDYNFFSNNHKMIDVYTRVLGEGRSATLPYIELDNCEFKMTGMGILKGSKLRYIADRKEAKIINLLRENKVSGIINLRNKTGEMTNLTALSMKKVKCKKEGDRYKFTIDLELDSDMIENNSYKKVTNNPKITKKIERETEEVVTKKTNNFIKKMQNEIKFDCLELGKVAAAKYGRRTNTDWDKVVCESEIKVNVKVKLERLGRGIL
ncbi:spore gernimation protein [Clostridium botulinum]|uniref:Spore gernimation protein n=2 Tax=Clostridium botulinum TaxID=1491 RepID=A0A0A0IIR7_CLOBO|nr:Ger(x)C family spore germination C-terminal domain-containing protein [Clostridium botulinum]KGM95142.1 spore gernimation protein [Clostridium botulinum D str. CCUG 7971]KGN00132.1 spore gernimation protein [Clostridium botulinum C/D str. DC5]KOC50765.1 spore gernimation protein [Clostridium botulinum]KOC53372.1 spore gernimation protein [Clostridium botulinum]KOC57154.1 spore gernimation protein [Clostridium botulinum]